jgi:glycosyltransferase involved in cell wall biosynthesis
MKQVTLPLVTVYIPCYNQASVVARALQSVLAQDYQKLDIIVADDASSDSTARVVAEFLKDSRIRYECSAKNIGRVANYRRGIMELARGEWFLNLDGDDYYDNPMYISAAVSMALEREDTVLIFGRQKYLDADTGNLVVKSAPRVSRWTPGKKFLLNYFSNNDGIPHMAALYRVEAARKCELFINDILFADAEAIVRLLPWGWVGYCGEFSGVWVFHGKNDSHRLSLDLRLANLKFITEPARFFVEHQVFSFNEAARWQEIGLRRVIREGLHFYLDNFSYCLAFRFWVRGTRDWPILSRLSVWLNWRVIVRLVFPWFSKFRDQIKKVV